MSLSGKRIPSNISGTNNFNDKKMLLEKFFLHDLQFHLPYRPNKRFDFAGWMKNLKYVIVYSSCAPI